MADQTRPLDAPLSHSNEAEHRRQIALRANQGVTMQAGTFTPTFTFATPGDLSVSYAKQAGWYWRMGPIVNFIIDLQFTPTFTTGSGTVEIHGLPYTSDPSGPVQIAIAQLSGTGITWPSGHPHSYGYINADGTVLRIAADGDGATTSGFGASNFATGVATGDIRFQGFYATAQ